MHVLMMLQYGKPAQYDEVSLLVHVGSIDRRRDLLKGRVGSAVEQPVEGSKMRSLAALLAVDLLEAENVGVDPDELGSHDCYPLFEARLKAGTIVEVPHVEGGYAQL